MNFKVSQLKSLGAGEVAVDDLIYVIDSNPTDGSVKSKKVSVGDLIDSRIYGISSSQFVLITGYYADPSWILSLDWSKIINAPSFVTSLSALTDVQLSTPLSGQALVYNGTKWINQGIGELDTLNSVTTRGNTTTNSITVGSTFVVGDWTTRATNVYVRAATGGADERGYYIGVGSANNGNGGSLTYNPTTNLLSLRSPYNSGTISLSLEGNTNSVQFHNTSGTVVSKFVSSTGNLLIGTTTDSGFKLDVNGTGRISSSLQFGTSNTSYISSPATGVLSLNSNIGSGCAVDINGQYKFYYGQLQGGGSAYFTTYLSVGTTSNLGATLNIKGAGSTSATTSLLVQNSSSTPSLTVLDNGLVSAGTSNTGVIMKNNGGYPSLAFWESVARWTIQREGSDVLNFVPNTTHAHGVISFVPGVYTGGVAIGSDTYQHASQLKPASAILSLYAESQGFLQPRLSTSQKNSIVTPATGLQLYDTTNNKNLLYNGTLWQNIATETWVAGQGYLTTTPTLAQVTAAGNTTLSDITVGGINSTWDYSLSRDAGSANTRLGRFKFIRSTYNPTGVSASIDFWRGGSAYEGILAFSTNGGSIGDTSVERMRITDSGNVLIGTTTDAGYKLDVNGSTRVGDTSSYGDVFVVKTPGNGWSFDYQYLKIGSVLKLGVDRLQLRVNNNTAYVSNDGDSGNSSLTLMGGYNGAGTEFAPVIFGSGRQASLVRETMRVDNQNQRVGIGTTTPTAKLHISGASNNGLLVSGLSSVDFVLQAGNLSGGSGTVQLYAGNNNNSFFRLNNEYIREGGNGGLGINISREDITAKLHVKGIGATSATTAFTVQNSISTTTFSVRDDGGVLIPGYTVLQGFTSIGAVQFYPVLDGGYTTSSTGRALRVDTTFNNTVSSTYAYQFGAFSLETGTASTINGTSVFITLAPTSGTKTFTALNVGATINATGTYSGIVRGIFYNSVLTSMTGVTHRAIETTSGDVIFNGGQVGIGTTSPTGRNGYGGGTLVEIVNNTAYASLNLNGGNISAPTYLTLGAQGSGADIRVNNKSLQFGINSIDALKIATTGNVLINTVTDAGYKLDVSGTFRTLVGTETNPFRLEHTNGNYMTMIVGAGSALAAGQFGMYFNGTPMWSWNGAVFRLHGNTISTASNPSTLILQGGYGGSTVGTSIRLSSNTPNQGQWTATTGAQTTVEIGNHSNETWAPSSGNASYTILSIAPRINTSGTYSGIVTGFAYNPTLTSITGVTHRAIHTVTGDVLLATTSGNVGIGTTSPVSKLNVYGGDIISSSATANRTTKLNDVGLYISRTSDGTYPCSITGDGGMIYDARNNHTFRSDTVTLLDIGNAYQNVTIGASQTSGARLVVKGSGSTSATSSLLIQNSSGSNALKITDDAQTFYYGTFNVVQTHHYSHNGGGAYRASESYNITDYTRSYGNAWTLQGGFGGVYATIKDGFYTLFKYSLNVSNSLSAPNASAILQADSTTQGFLPPRLTTAQILAIASPAEGLQVYNTDLHVICFYDGTAWRKVSHSTM